MTKTTEERFAMKIQNRIESADTTLAEFAKEVAADPAYALEWADRAAAAAVGKKICLPILELLERGVDLKDIRGTVLDLLLSASASGMSSSPSSNMMAAHRRAVAAEILREFN